MTEAQKTDEATVRKWAVIVGAVLEFLLTVQTTAVVAFYIRHGGNYPSYVYPSPNYLALGAAAIFPFAFSIAHKYFAKPKGRVVSSAAVFFMAFVFNAIFLVDYVIRSPPDYFQGTLIPTLPIADVWGGFATFTFIFLAIVGFLASFSVAGVRLALGLSVEGVDRKTISIPLHHEKVFSAFKSGSSSSGYLSRFREQEQDENGIILKRKYPTGDEVIIAFGYFANELGRGTLVATAAYGKNAYGIFPSKLASGNRDSVLNDIVGRCAENGKLPETTEFKDLNDFLSDRVYQVAVSPAKAWLSIIKDGFLELEGYFKAAIISTVAAAIVATVASAEGFLGQNYGDVLTVLYAFIVGEVGLAIREERAKGKKSPSWKFSSK